MRIRDISEHKDKVVPETSIWPETHEEAGKLLRLARRGFSVEEAKEKLRETKCFDALLEQVDEYNAYAPKTDFADVLVNFLVNLPAKNQAIATMQDSIWSDTDLTPMIMPQLQMAEGDIDTTDVVSKALHEDLHHLTKVGKIAPEEKNKKLLMRAFQSNVKPNELRVHYLKKFKEKGLLETGKLINATFSFANDINAAKKTGKVDKDQLTTMLFKNANKHGVDTKDLHEKFRSIYIKQPVKETVIEESKIDRIVKELHNQLEKAKNIGGSFSTAFYARKIAKKHGIKPSDVISKYNEFYHGDKINEEPVNGEEVDLHKLAVGIDATTQLSGAEIKFQDALSKKFGKDFANWYIHLMNYADHGEYPAKAGENVTAVTSYLKRNKDQNAAFIKLAKDYNNEIHTIANAIAKDHSSIVHREIAANKERGVNGAGKEYKVAEDVVNFPGNPTPPTTQKSSAVVKDFNKPMVKNDKSVDDIAAWAKWFIDSEIEAGRINGTTSAMMLHNKINNEADVALKDKVEDPEDAIWQAFNRMFNEGIWYYILDKANLLDSLDTNESITEGKGIVTAHKARNHLARLINKFVDSSNINLLSSAESFEDRNYFDLAINVYEKNSKKLERIRSQIIECMIKHGYVQNSKKPEQFMISDAVLVHTKPIHSTFRTGAYKNREVPTFTIVVTGKKKMVD